ncbi:UDP-glucose-4-epimerase [Tulasnella sp. 403]|nr:UDP-glucose-4-epimerase [Tulasnella sp. 403]
MSSITSLKDELSQILKTMGASPMRPLPKTELDAIVSDMLERTKSGEKQVEWEYIDETAGLEGTNPTYYQDIMDLLDVVLTLSELKACDAGLPLLVLEDVFDTQTVVSCMKLFAWLELRTARATIVNDMNPSKGKGPTLLRSLNNLLRRISKTGSTSQFCGRILIFLSSVFPFGERSGVNLRGEYGPAWTPVDILLTNESEKMEGVESTSETTKEEGKDDSSAQAPPVPQPSASDAPDKKVRFYNTFWSLQTYFARPQVFVNKDALPKFKEAVDTVLSALAEATRKDHTMMGTVKGVTAGTKRKYVEVQKSSVVEDTTAGLDYFFAKFLTSPELLDFELSDTIFRRQVLVQLAILLRHLLTFTQKEKANWVTQRNLSLQMEFTLPEADEKWAREILARTMLEMRSTSPDGKAFADTVLLILERDKNWVRWKNDVCPPMDSTAQLARAADEEQRAGKSSDELQEEEAERWAKAFKRWIPSSEVDDDSPLRPYGSENLEEAWLGGVRDLEDLEDPQTPGDLDNLYKQIKGQELRKEQLRKRKGLPARTLPQAKPSRATTPLPLPSVPSPHGTPGGDGAVQANGAETESASPAKPESRLAAATSGTASAAQASSTRVVVSSFELTPQEEDPGLREFDLRKQSLTWLALRLAIREGHLHHFNKINGGDINILIQEIKNAKNAPATLQAAPAMSAEPSTDAEDTRSEMKVDAAGPSESDKAGPPSGPIGMDVAAPKEGTSGSMAVD